MEIKIGLMSKKRENVVLQEKLGGEVVDHTEEEVKHHEEALRKAGYHVEVINWGDDILYKIRNADVDLLFNVSTMIEAALAEELSIPYVGSDQFSIAVATDKSLAKRIWQLNGLPTSPFRVVGSKEDCEVFSDDPPFAFPFFVKPVYGRGSAGIDDFSVVESYEELVRKTSKIIDKMGQPALVERYLQGREITIGVLGNDPARALPLLEIEYPDDFVLGFENKEKELAEFICPADLSERLTGLMQNIGLSAYHAVGMRDYGRIDTILTDEGPFILEANTFAGLACIPVENPISYVGRMAVATGISGSELLDEIVQSALVRYNNHLGRPSQLSQSGYREMKRILA